MGKTSKMADENNEKTLFFNGMNLGGKRTPYFWSAIHWIPGYGHIFLPLLGRPTREGSRTPWVLCLGVNLKGYTKKGRLAGWVI